ncbi:MBL fold metallo-hydrolase [Streptomyces californicus]|uniref:MBL fold metallo-hydrolase n=1 Tax=Streptomyces californicus TaxID=67351 RepID=UPI0036472010
MESSNFSKSNAIAPATQLIQQEAFTDSSGTFIYWLSGSGFLINSRGTLIMIDPVISLEKGKNDISEIGIRMSVSLPIEASSVPQLDAVLYTHGDNDHMGKYTPSSLVHKGTLFGGTPPVLKNLESLGVPVGQYKSLDIGETFRVGQIEITTTPADHPWQEKNPAKYGNPWGPKDCCGFLIKTLDGTIWCPGDTRLLPEHLQMKGIDVLLLDVSWNEYHLGPESAITLANTYSNAYLIPYHYGSYETEIEALNGNPMELAPSITSWQKRLHVLAPGEKFKVSRFEDEHKDNMS